MFATPVYIPRNVLDPSTWASKRDSQARVDTISRISMTSSACSSDLHRTSSTSSNHSSSTSASSVGSVSPVDRPKHRKTFSSSSIGIPRRLLTKPRPQGRQRSDSAPTSSPYDTTVPPAPYIPTCPPPPPPPPRPAPPPAIPRPSREILSEPKIAVRTPEPRTPSRTQAAAAEWQCSDLVVRCKNDVYHVDRDVMCYHSRWFARICAIIKSPKTAKSVIDLGADDPEAVAAMMQYCYQLDYTTQTSGSDASVSEEPMLISHVKVCMLAERYGISGLKNIAVQKFEALVNMILMVDGNEEQLLHAIRALYAAERRADANELKHVAVKLCANHVQAFIHGTGNTMAMVFESMDEFPEFRSDLFEEMACRWRG